MDFILLHDAATSKKKYPEGKAVYVRPDSIDILRGYKDGRVRTVVGVRGQFLHVTESVHVIMKKIERAKQGRREIGGPSLD